MKCINIKDFIKILKFDSISKFNIELINQLVNIDQVYIRLNLYTNDPTLIKKYILVNKLFRLIFDQKLTILKIKKVRYRSKKGLFFHMIVGVSLYKSLFFINLNFLHNIIGSMSKKNHEKVVSKRNKRYFTFQFSNLNYILGLDFTSINYMKMDWMYLIDLKGQELVKSFYEKVLFNIIE